MPMYVLPYIDLSLPDAVGLGACLSVSASSVNGSSNLSRNFACEASSSGADAEDDRARALELL